MGILFNYAWMGGCTFCGVWVECLWKGKCCWWASLWYGDAGRFFYGALLFWWWLFGESDWFKNGVGGGQDGYVGGLS